MYIVRMGRHTKPSLVTSVEARPPGVSFESRIIHDGPSLFWSVESFSIEGRGTDDLVESFGGAETRRTGTDHKYIDRSVKVRIGLKRGGMTGGSLQVRHLSLD